MERYTSVASEFSINEKVLAKWFDQKYYAAFIMKVNSRDDWCQVVYIEDQIVKWIPAKDIKKFEGNLRCVVCYKDSVSSSDPTFQCSRCSAAFHRDCYSGLGEKRRRISGSTVWKCSECLELPSPPSSPNKLHKSPPTSQRSPTRSDKSPTRSDKSPTRSDKSPTRSDKSPTRSDKSPTRSDKSHKKLPKLLPRISRFKQASLVKSKKPLPQSKILPKRSHHKKKPSAVNKKLLQQETAEDTQTSPRSRLLAGNFLCRLCSKWVPTECLKPLKLSLLFGDQFYHLKCKQCNKGPPTFHRIKMTWEQLAEFVWFSMYSAGNGRAYFDFYQDILPFTVYNWNSLSCHHFNDISFHDFEHIMAAVMMNSQLFKSGREVKKKSTLFMRRQSEAPYPTPQQLCTRKIKLEPVFNPAAAVTTTTTDVILTDTWKKTLTLRSLLTAPKSLTTFICDKFHTESRPLRLFIRHTVTAKPRSSKQQPVRITGSVVKVMASERRDAVAAQHILTNTLNNALETAPESASQSYHGYRGTDDFVQLLLNGDLKDCEPGSLFTEDDDTSSDSPPPKLRNHRNSPLTQRRVKHNTDTQSSDSSPHSRLRARAPKRKLCQLVSAPALRKFPNLDANGNDKLWQMNNNHRQGYTESNNHTIHIEKRGRGRPAKNKHTHITSANIVNNIQQLSQCYIPDSYLRNSVAKYFNSSQRIISGEKYSIGGRRTGSNGAVEYLVLWEK